VARAGHGGGGDLGVDDAYRDPAEHRPVGAVVIAVQDRQFRPGPAGLGPYQQVCAALGDGGQQLPGGEVAVGQQDHPGP
jgi:hypothetical protein